MRKATVSAIAISVSFFLLITVMLLPVISAVGLAAVPIVSAVNFVSETFGIDVDEDDDMDTIILAIYSISDYQEIIDNVMADYSDNDDINYYSIIEFYVFSQCDDITTENTELIAEFISSYGLDDSSAIADFLLTTSPFKEACETAGLDEDTLVSLFDEYGYSDETELDSSMDISDDLETGELIAAYAQSRLGCPYYWGASGPNYFDCSGLVYWCHKQAGVSISRSTANSYASSGKAVSYSDLQAGDIVAFKRSGASRYHHIAIYIGNGYVIHASGEGSTCLGNHASLGHVVKKAKLSSFSYSKTYRRLY